MATNNLANPGFVTPPTANPSADPAAAAAANPQQAQPLLAGKYKSVQELEAGYSNQQTQTNAIIKERDALARKAAILESLVKEGAAGGNGGMVPAPRSGAQSAIEQYAEATGQDPQLVAAAMREAANQAFAPITAAIAARQKVGAEFPEFGRFETEVSQFLNANPEIAAEYNVMVSNPDTAAAGMRYAFLMATAAARANAGAQPAQAPTTQDLSGQQQATARLDAMIPGGAGGGGRAAALDAAAQAEGAALLAKARGKGSGPELDAYLRWAWGNDPTR